MAIWKSQMAVWSKCFSGMKCIMIQRSWFQTPIRSNVVVRSPSKSDLNQIFDTRFLQSKPVIAFTGLKKCYVWL